MIENILQSFKSESEACIKLLGPILTIEAHWFEAQVRQDGKTVGAPGRMV